MLLSNPHSHFLTRSKKKRKTKRSTALTRFALKKEKLLKWWTLPNEWIAYVLAQQNWGEKLFNTKSSKHFSSILGVDGLYNVKWAWKIYVAYSPWRNLVYPYNQRHYQQVPFSLPIKGATLTHKNNWQYIEDFINLETSRFVISNAAGGWLRFDISKN